MSIKRYIDKTVRPIIVIMVLTFTGCSMDDGDEPMRGAAVEVMSCLPPFEEQATATRAWTPPTGYSLYPDADKSISVFFTEDGAEPAEEEFFFKSSGNWHVSKTDLAAKTYYLYGYVPHENYIDVSVAAPGSGDFADGAVLTIENLNAITPSDVCVITGARNGKDDYRADADYSVTGLTRGDFAYAALATTGSGNNYVYLLFDHLYAALRIQMRVHADYDALRTIKLKALHLQACAGSAPIKQKTNATVALTATGDGSDPVSSVTFTPSGDAAADGTMFESAEGETLTTDYSSYMSCFMPQDVTTFVLTSTYDVYDKRGNLTRPDCVSTNSVVLKDVLAGQTTTFRGRRYTINMTIKPTYLYVMSDPDLDNPTLVVD